MVFPRHILRWPAVLAVLAAGAALHAQPIAPERPAMAKAASGFMAEAVPSTAFASGFVLDTSRREEVRLFHKTVYAASENTPMGWTGSYTDTDPVAAAGTTSEEFKDAVMLRVNYFRAMAGVPAIVARSATYSAKAQQAALMMSANRALSHTPPSNWLFYSADGAEAAGKSNLALGIAGPDAIDGYMADYGSGNAAVGHRRWVVHPQTRTMGTGDVAGGSGNPAANALWVFDGLTWAARPAVRDSFVAWPCEGYIPCSLVFPRWSFGWPGASFAAATVTMTRDGVPVSVVLAPVSDGYGENTLVWTPGGLDPAGNAPHARPASDVVYDVTVGNVFVGGQYRTFHYQTIVFDPEVAGPDAVETSLTGPDTAAVGAAASFGVVGLDYATGFQWRPLVAAPCSAIEGAENGATGLTVVTSGGYNVIERAVKASGSASFHLAHPVPEEQSITLGPAFLAGPSAQLVFQSRLATATANQAARVQISLDGGTAWTDVYQQAGSGPPGETGFVARTVALAAWAGRVFHLRFAYTAGSGSYYPQTSTSVGWFFDDIALTGVSTVEAGAASGTLAGSTFGFTPASAGTFGLQARAVHFGSFPGEWGPVKTVVAAMPQMPVVDRHPDALSVGEFAQAVFTVEAAGATRWQWSRDGVELPGADEASLVLPCVRAADAGTYTVTVSNSAGSATSRGAALEVTSASRLFFGTFGTAETGTFALAVAPDGTGTFRASVAGMDGWIMSDAVVVGAGGAFSFAAGALGTVTGAIAGNGVTGALGAGPAFAGSIDPLAGATSGTSGLYEAVVVGTSDGSVEVLVGNDGRAWCLVGGGGVFTGAIGAADASGAVGAVLPDGRTLLLAIDAASSRLTGTLAEGGTGRAVAGARAGVEVDRRLVNISVRAQAQTGDGLMIAGFVVSGAGRKNILVRAAGPTLRQFGVDGCLENPHIRLFRQSDPPGAPPIAENDDWSTAAGADTVRSVAATVGAFPLDEGGRDAALLIDLPAGAYTAHVSGVDGTTGTALAEIYDADAALGLEPGANLVNISMRGVTGAGDAVIIAGIVIEGDAPKRVLIRGVGPELGSFGVGGVLSNPELRVYRKREGMAQDELVVLNADWCDAGQEAVMASTAAAVGAFALESGSRSAGLVVWLEPGVYTAHVASGDGSSGVVIVETYEVP